MNTLHVGECRMYTQNIIFIVYYCIIIVLYVIIYGICEYKNDDGIMVPISVFNIVRRLVAFVDFLVITFACYIVASCGFS